MTNALLRGAALLLLAAPMARAQEEYPPPSPLPPALSIVADTSLLPFDRPNGLLLRPVSLMYDLSLTRADTVLPLGVRAVQVAESSIGGIPSWLITESRTGTLVETSDSLFVTRADLTPERWVATSAKAMVGASFTRDSVIGALQSYQGRSSFTLALGSGALVTPGMVERVVELLPLEAGYRAGASLLIVELGASRTVPATISVERDERLRVGEAELECWLVAIRTASSEQRLWVTKDVPRVVKTEQAVPGGVLTAIARP